MVPSVSAISLQQAVCILVDLRLFFFFFLLAVALRFSNAERAVSSPSFLSILLWDLKNEMTRTRL